MNNKKEYLSHIKIVSHGIYAKLYINGIPVKGAFPIFGIFSKNIL